jgi:hypothetical protein
MPVNRSGPLATRVTIIYVGFVVGLSLLIGWLLKLSIVAISIIIVSALLGNVIWLWPRE